MIETLELVDPWLALLLGASAELAALVGDRISGTLSTVPLATPYVHFEMQSTRDVITGSGGDRIDTDNLYLVKVVDQTGSWDDMLPAFRIIDALFDRPYEVIDVPGGCLSSVRNNLIQYPEVDQGIQYRHLGAVYRIRASAGAL